MIITRKSPFSGKTNTKDIDVTMEQLEAWRGGGMIQNVMPHLSASDREFLMTGITDDEWPSEQEEAKGSEESYDDDPEFDLEEVLS
jgi:hypothetical protein